MRQHRLVALRIVRAEDVVAPRVPEAEVPADLGVDAVAAHLDRLTNPLVVVLVAREERQPRAEILELQVLGSGLDQVLHLGVEDRAERHGEVPGVLVVLEVGVPGEVGGPGADRHLDGHLGVLLRDLVQVGEPNRASGDRAAIDDAAPVVHDLAALRFLSGADRARVLLASGLEAADALVHVPAERADDADVVVVPHVAVGDDVEAGLFLIPDDGRHGVVIRLFVLNFLEGDANVAAEQLMLEPVRPRIRTDHGGRKNSIDDLRCHSLS